jgi:hypothetical protein
VPAQTSRGVASFRHTPVVTAAARAIEKIGASSKRGPQLPCHPLDDRWNWQSEIVG